LLNKPPAHIYVCFFLQKIEFFISLLVLLGDVLEGLPRNKPQKNPAPRSGVLIE